MLPARISLIQAALTLLLALLCAALAALLYKYRRKSRYPNRTAALLCASLSAWLVLNVFDDRTSSPQTFVWLSRAGYALAAPILFNFVILALHFPPRSTKLFSRIVILACSLMGIFVVFTALHPAAFLNYFDTNTQKLLVHLDQPYFYVVMAVYILFVAIAAIVFAHKWHAMQKNDRVTAAIILGGFFATVISAIAFAFWDAKTQSEPYVFAYSYFSVGIFACTLAYSILRNGVFETSITFRRRAVFGGAGILATVVLLLVFLRVGSLEQLTVLQLTLGSVATAVVSLVILDGLFELRQKTYVPSLSNIDASVATETFLRASKKYHALTWCRWEGEPRAVNNNIEQMNSVDVPESIAKRLQSETFHEAGPQRTALRISTARGTLITGRKKYHITFTEKELRTLRHEVNLHAAHLELSEIRRARRNHLAELQTLTEQRRARLTLANQTFLEKLQKRARFFKLVAEELRTPLNVIANAVHAGGSLPNVTAGSLILPPAIGKTITDSTDRLLDLTAEIQELGSRSLDTPLIEWIKINNICADVHARYKLQTSDKNLTLHLIGHPANARVAIKQIHLEQVLDNLIGNAIKYSPARSTITATLRVTPGRLLISVADEGPGVPLDEQPLIFEPFFRTENTRHIKGTGLGLAVVKRIATTYQGQARVYNRTPTGAVFEVDLSVRTDISADQTVRTEPSDNKT